jgi:type II secretory pathway pseudopilin PulG
MKSASVSKQGGITLVGLIFVLALVGLVGVLALKVLPTVIEFMSIKKAMTAAKASGTTPLEIKRSFDKQTDVGYIDSVSSKDLELTPNGDQIDVSIAYQKKIPMFGPVSLLIDYAATTATGTPVATVSKKPAS